MIGVASECKYMWTIIRGVIEVDTRRFGMPASSPRHAQNPSLVALGLAIRRMRQVRKISQEELAHQSGIDRSYMSSIERGQQNPGIMSVLSIAATLQASAEDLMREAGL